MGDRQESKGAKGLLNEPSQEPDELARQVIGAAIGVHRHLGPGFAENVYEEALALELAIRGIPFSRQFAVHVTYKGTSVGHGRVDFLIGGKLVVELKTLSTLTAVHQAQVISYLRALGTRLGLLLNFREVKMRSGSKRVVLGHNPLGHTNEPCEP